jgi:phytoene dehydrogenase-like protein
MSALAFIIGTGNYHKGARFPLNGFHHFFNSIKEVIKKNGGSVETGKRVISLYTENNQIKSAKCDDGSEYICDYIFSDISPRLTYQLFGNDFCKFNYSPSHSIPVVCIGVDRGLDSISELKGRNYWWQDGNEINYENPDITAPPRMLYIGSPTANGNSGLESYDKDGIVVFCPGNFNQEKEIYSRGEDAVEKFKKNLIDQVLTILDQNVFPGLKSRLLFAEMVSSLDIEMETGGEMGNAYGRRLNVAEIMKGCIEEEKCPENLFNVSAAKNIPGIAGGIYTATRLLEELTGIKVGKGKIIL